MSIPSSDDVMAKHVQAMQDHFGWQAGYDRCMQDTEAALKRVEDERDDARGRLTLAQERVQELQFELVALRAENERLAKEAKQYREAKIQLDDVMCDFRHLFGERGWSGDNPAVYMSSLHDLYKTKEHLSYRLFTFLDSLQNMLGVETPQTAPGQPDGLRERLVLDAVNRLVQQVAKLEVPGDYFLTQLENLLRVWDKHGHKDMRPREDVIIDHLQQVVNQNTKFHQLRESIQRIL